MLPYKLIYDVESFLLIKSTLWVSQVIKDLGTKFVIAISVLIKLYEGTLKRLSANKGC